MIFKEIIAFCALLWLYWTFKTVMLGLKERQRRKSWKKWKGRWTPEKHRKAAIVLYCCLVATILSVGAMHFLVSHHEGTGNGLVFAIHLPSAVLLLCVLSVMLFWKTGIQDARLHHNLAWAVFVLTPVVFVTGSILLARA